ncbi:type VI secretion system tube protein TssD [Fibrivirga algicola]|uniref:Type VI secretion system needle protein Hcp n=1 Tax=Fibrivirga algicola TaxID=2950420 RepID=A0ABX0QI29_9BACT|nr:type VI secretion system tube protein TssD [Fibrivirga algicola]NID12116.1 hypothetical protein [Fibrivirga algicola]
MADIDITKDMGSWIKVDKGEYTVLSLSYGFSKQIGMDGKTASRVMGGDINVSIQTLKADKVLLELVLAQNKNDIKGEIYINGSEGQVRKIEFSHASISSFNESFSGGQGMQNFTITAGILKAQEVEFNLVPKQGQRA